MNNKFRPVKLLCFAMAFIMLLCPLLSYADEIPDYEAEAEARKSEPVESNNWENWPDGPIIGAEAAILMVADTGEILYAKNIDERLYPASTTKIMTCLVAVENAALEEKVTISSAAINANDWDGTNMGLKAGEILTVDELLQGMLITSANEACNAIGEHIAGSMEGYVQMMNDKAKELGLENTHFVTTNGLHDDNHYTSARDLAIIASEFFKYDVLCKYSSKAGALLEANSDHEEHEFYSKNKLLKNREYAYEYLVGTKTGYTGDSRQCLVSCAEKDGVRLICVILKEESPYQFEDTINLFEYGFNNFTKVNVTSNETKYDVNHADFFMSETDPVIYINPDASVLLPVGASFEELTSSINYNENTPPYFGTINYYYYDAYVGSAEIAFRDEALSYDSFSDSTPAEDLEREKETQKKQILVNIKKVFTIIFIIIGVIVFGFLGFNIYKKYHFTERNIVNPGFFDKNVIKKRKASAKRRRKPIKPVKAFDSSDYITPKKNNRPRPRKPVNRDKFNFDDFNL